MTCTFPDGIPWTHTRITCRQPPGRRNARNDTEREKAGQTRNSTPQMTFGMTSKWGRGDIFTNPLHPHSRTTTKKRESRDSGVMACL